jgi:hypothetical protein
LILSKRLILLYDNKCYYCSRFATLAAKLTANRLTLVGLYSKEGDELKASFPKGINVYEMFWFIDGLYAYGGLYGLFKLLMVIIPNLLSINNNNNIPISIKYECKHDYYDDCRLISRIYNLITKRSKVKLIKE